METLDVLIHTHEPLSSSQIDDMKEKGLRLVASIPGDNYRLRGNTDLTLADINAMSFVAAVSPYDPTDKLDDTLRQTVMMSAAADVAGLDVPEGTVNVLVSLDPHADPAGTLAAIAQTSEVLDSSSRRALAKVNPSKVSEIAALPGVTAVEIEPDSRLHNNVARTLTRVEPIATGIGLDGTGEIVGVADSGLDSGVNDGTMLADFAGRIVNIRATVNKAPFGVADGADLNGHGTHVTGSILGDGTNSNGQIKGMAPAASITMLSMGPNNSTGLAVPADLITGVFQDAYNDGARLHSNSWGQLNNPGKYTAYSEDVDTFTRDNPDLLIVIAAGNEGPGASTVSAPGTAKNCLTVGASESVRPLPANITINPNLQDSDFNPATPKVNTPLSLPVGPLADNADDIATFSSRGPTNDTGDSRIKPDIVAPGTFILSCRSQVCTADVGPDGIPRVSFYEDDADGVASHAEAVGRGLPGAPFFGTWNQLTPDAPAGSGPIYQQNYMYNSGTSMATPITTGATALLRQYLRQRRGIANPSAALMKALLVNGATVPSGASNSPDNTRGFGWLNMENTLTPAPTGQQTYSDDIDLAVATGDVRHFSVQVANPAFPLRVTLAWNDHPGKGVQNKLYLRVIAPGGATFDGDVSPFPTVSNNVQRVHIATPVAGTYTIEVHGLQVLFGIASLLPAIRQDFALAIINGLGFSPEPVDIAQVVDRSGSMDFYGFMAPARERAKQLVDMLRINDRTGVVSFEGTATTVNPVVPIAGFATQDSIKANIDGIMAGGVTSIGAGLERGRAELQAGGDPTHPQALVLISDGHENTPPWVGGGLTDSPPSWYGGPDFTEVLPTVPATTTIYTVSLGVQSDEVLLQDIAAARGGVFHAIHSPADIGKLHEIYVHLQALIGGEEVITAGSDSVDGLGIDGAVSVAMVADAMINPLPAPLRVNSRAFPELADIINLNTLAADTPATSTNSANSHIVPVDDTVTSVVMMVSWHEEGLPVSLSLVTPSLKTITLGSTAYINRAGSSYQFFRIDNPEPGEWTMRITADKSDGNKKGSHTYTWGAYGTSPVGIRCQLPKKLQGVKQLKLTAQAIIGDRLVRTLRIVGEIDAPTISTGDLLKRLKGELDDIKLPFEPDTSKLDPNLFKLGILDRQIRANGKPSIFRTKQRRLALTKPNNYTGVVETPLPGIYAIQLVASGKTRKGFPYLRQSLRSVRT